MPVPEYTQYQELTCRVVGVVIRACPCSSRVVEDASSATACATPILADLCAARAPRPAARGLLGVSNVARACTGLDVYHQQLTGLGAYHQQLPQSKRCSSNRDGSSVPRYQNHPALRCRGPRRRGDSRAAYLQPLWKGRATWHSQVPGLCRRYRRTVCKVRRRPSLLVWFV